MFRRCVSILVIAGFLASQLAAVPHAHGVMLAEEQRRHDSTPHFHWGLADWFASRAGHEHGHAHHHDHHHHHDHDSHRSLGETESLPAGTGPQNTDHDTDAIPVPGANCAAPPTNLNDRAPAVWQNASPAALPSWHNAACAISTAWLHWHPPDVVLDASGLYLTLRNLRI